MVAGVAAGMAAVFRTPLGAALLAVEVLYRDDFESDALVPAVLASVIAYSVVISIFGESTLFAHAPRYPFVAGAPAALRRCSRVVVALLAVAVRRRRCAACSALSQQAAGPGLGAARRSAASRSASSAVPTLIVFVGRHIGVPGQGLGILGGGYGAAQVAITGADLAARRLAAVRAAAVPRASPS